MIAIDNKIRVGEVIIPDSFPVKDNFVRSGFKVLEALDKGLKVRRIHTYHLCSEEIESWVLRWDQLQSFNVLPDNTQIPLF